MTSKIKGTHLQKRSTSRGQSIIEFAIILPIYLGLMFYLIQSTMAINGGIVYQQYAREKLFGLFWNHRDYPKLLTTINTQRRAQTGWQRFWIGIDNETWLATDLSEREDTKEIAPRVRAGYSQAEADADAESNDAFPATNRKSIRVRIKTFICLGPKFLPLGRNASGAAQSAPYLTDIGTMNDATFRDGGTVKLCDSQD